MSKSGKGSEVHVASGMALSSVKALEAAPVGEDLLLALCRQGDQGAFPRLVAQHEAMVFSLAARLLGNLDEAHDVAQDVFLRVFRALGRFEGRSRLKTWIYRIVVNQCRNRRRFWQRRARQKTCALETLNGVEEARLATGALEAVGVPGRCSAERRGA